MEVQTRPCRGVIGRVINLFLICFSLILIHCGPPPLEARVEEILQELDSNGGIIVHLGGHDGRLTEALGRQSNCAVHGLYPDPGEVKKAVEYISAVGQYGPVSVELFSGEKLPYTDNLINRIVVDEQGGVTDQELMRVLAPGGIAIVRQDGQWERMVKERPTGMDDWTHFLHGPDNNAVADDSLVGPPRRIQWEAGPLWLRSHETPSGLQNLVSGDGRIFYFFDEGVIGITDARLPSRWALVARDAFNGTLLWKKPLTPWGWREWSGDVMEGKDWTQERAYRTVVPEQNQRRMVLHRGKLLTTMGFNAPLSILDPSTGEELRVIQGTEPTIEVVASDGIAVAFVSAEETSVWPVGNQTGFLKAVDCESGEILWSKPVEGFRPLQLAVRDGKVYFVGGDQLVCAGLTDGAVYWEAKQKDRSNYTLVVSDQIVLVLTQKSLLAFDVNDGKQLWSRKNEAMGGSDRVDLFFAQGLVWQGVFSADEKGQPAKKSEDALAVGLDPLTGKTARVVSVDNLRSPEHHHRCYRNKATAKYIMTALEGIEFVDLEGDSHSQNNFVRGSCKYGVMPCNGLVYVPPDQCFCEPGAKLLGFTALASSSGEPLRPVPDQERLARGAAYGKVESPKDADEGAWPTYRHGSTRWGSTDQKVGDQKSWGARLEGRLTPPVAAQRMIYVAQIDAHTLYALDADTGVVKWSFTASGRIDSPPTVYKGLLLFGSRDGWAYCLRASDGEEVWRFLAAPADRRVASEGQIESVWPVHGSVLVKDDVVYLTAGRSTYLDGGIRLYALNPETGEILHKGLLEGPDLAAEGSREASFYILGANSDVLVSEGDYLYMRQKKLTPTLEEVRVPVKSSKGAQDVGLHLFSTSGLLDGSWYNRTFWMYSSRWPGFQLANQAPKSGQILVVDQEKTYAVKVFHRRNVHSTMFFPGQEGYLLYADQNGNEPQIVGEEGARPPLEWLPQSEYSRGSSRGGGLVKLNYPSFGEDKMVGYTRAEPPLWKVWLKIRVRGLVKAGDYLYAAGAEDVLDEKNPVLPFEESRPAPMVKVSAKDGSVEPLSTLPSQPVFDGMIAAYGRLYVSCVDGSVVCLGDLG